MKRMVDKEHSPEDIMLLVQKMNQDYIPDKVLSLLARMGAKISRKTLWTYEHKYRVIFPATFRDNRTTKYNSIVIPQAYAAYHLGGGVNFVDNTLKFSYELVSALAVAYLNILHHRNKLVENIDFLKDNGFTPEELKMFYEDFEVVQDIKEVPADKLSTFFSPEAYAKICIYDMGYISLLLTMYAIEMERAYGELIRIFKEDAEQAPTE